MTSWHIQLYLGCLLADFVIWVRKSWLFCLGWCWLSTGKVAKSCSHTQNTTTNTRTTHNNQNKQPLPPYPAALLSLHELGSSAPKSLQGCCVWVRCRCPALDLRTRWLVPLSGINFQATSKNREIGGALALDGRRFINQKYIQQSNGSWCTG